MTTKTPVILDDKVVNTAADALNTKAVTDTSITTTDFSRITNTQVESNLTEASSDSVSAARFSSKSYKVTASGFIYKSIASLFDDVPDHLQLTAKNNSGLSATTLELPTDTTASHSAHKPSLPVSNKLKKNSVDQDKKFKLKNAVPAATANREKSSTITPAVKEESQSVWAIGLKSSDEETEAKKRAARAKRFGIEIVEAPPTETVPEKKDNNIPAENKVVGISKCCFKCGSSASDIDKIEAEKRALRAKRFGIDNASAEIAAEDVHQCGSGAGKKPKAEGDGKATNKRRSNNISKDAIQHAHSKGFETGTNSPSKKRRARQEPERHGSSAKRHRQEPHKPRHIPTYTGRNERRRLSGGGRAHSGSSHQAGTTNGRRNNNNSQREGRNFRRR